MPAPTRLALVTCRDLPVPDVDVPHLERALAGAGVTFEWAAWDDVSVDWSRYRAAWLRSPWNYIDDVEAFLSWIDDVGSCTEVWNPPDIVRWNAHKSYLLDLASRGVPVVPTVLVERGRPLDLTELSARNGWREVVVKPAVAVGAIGARVVRVDDGDDDERTEIDRLVQPLVPEIAEGEVSMVAIDGEVTHAVRKRPAPGDFRVHVEYGGREEAHPPTPDELALARKALDAVGRPLLYARIDCVVTSAGPLLMELELIEPSLFLPLAPAASLDRLAAAVAGRMTAG
jgi:hypothetical protein